MKISNRGNCVASLLSDILIVVIVEIVMIGLGYFMGFSGSAVKMATADAVSFSIQLFYGLSMILAVVGMWFPTIIPFRYIASSVTLTILWASYVLLGLTVFSLPEFGEIALTGTSFIMLFTVQQFIRDKLRKSDFLKEVLSELTD